MRLKAQDILKTENHRFLSRISRDESGSMTVFGLLVFFMILIIGGLAVDVMHSEMRRTRLQDTLDRAILSASSLTQDLAPEEVVRDYFEVSGLENHLGDISVDAGLGYKSVAATASASVNTHFMRLVGVDSLSYAAASGGEERIGGVEISMVLDVSGSMNSNNRLGNLKVAAKEFIDTLTDTTEPGNLSFSIVPYATQVSAPPELVAQMNVSNEHNYSNCVNFDSGDFRTSGIDFNSTLDRTMHFYPWGSTDKRTHSVPQPFSTSEYAICPPSSDNSRKIQVLQNDATALKAFIDSMTARGNTSIDLGMKWGTALLDPTMQGAVSDLIDDDFIPDDFDGRPYGYDEGETIKVIVLMTDGQNTSQYYVNQNKRVGASGVWFNPSDNRYSVNTGPDIYDRDRDGDRDEDIYFWVHNQQWHDQAYGDGSYETTQTVRRCVRWRRNGSCRRYRNVQETVTVQGGDAVSLSYGDLFAFTSMYRNAGSNFGPWMGRSAALNEWYYGAYSYVGSGTKNTRTQDICNAAKAQGIVVYTIGFEAPSSGQAVIRNCASSDSHYFDVRGLQIRDAFSSIAASIRQLRLTL